MTLLPCQDYTIYLGEVNEILDRLSNNWNYSTYFVITDDCVATSCLHLIRGNLPPFKTITVPHGEQNKSLETCSQIWGELLAGKADRHSLIINLGGGVIGDMGGFAACCFMRGLDFIQIPTTLLSQVDASVGGKLGIDFQDHKNYLGLFSNPQAVVIDPVFLKSLPNSELRSGFAELIKHSLIADRHIWDRLNTRERWSDSIREDEIKASIEIKKMVVEKDPHEAGLRKILNFGHTVGHAIESFSFQGRKPLLHGEAIALGMLCETYMSGILTGLSKQEQEEIESYVKTVFDDVDPDLLGNHQAILNYILGDKKNKKGKIMCSLLPAIGNCLYDIEISEEHIRASLDHVSRIHKY